MEKLGIGLALGDDLDICGNVDRAAALEADGVSLNEKDDQKSITYIRQKELHQDVKVELRGTVETTTNKANVKLVLKGRDCTDGKTFFCCTLSKDVFDDFTIDNSINYERLQAILDPLEQQAQRTLLLACQSISGTDCLKHLRRQLPITKTRLDWDKLVISSLQ
jgi:hypothetical protein